MSRLPDFSQVPFRNGAADQKADVQTWDQAFAESTGQGPDDLRWLTNERVSVKTLYTAADTED